jgi:uncharacterized protein (TIRG00374 family)
MTKGWRQTLLRLVVGSAATGSFLWLFLRHAQLGAAWREIRRLSGWPLLGALGLLAANYGFTALRWRYLFEAARVNVSLRQLVPTLCVGCGANNVLPARGGDLLRIESLRQQAAVPAFIVAGTLFAERLLDGLVLATWIVLGAAVIGEGGALLLTGVGLAAGAVLGVVLVALAARNPARAETVVWRLVQRLPGRWHGKIGRATANFVEGLGAFRARKPLVRILWTSVAIWLADLGMYVVIGRAFHLDLSLGGYFLLEGIGNLALGVPATAAGLGSFDYLTFLAAKGIGVTGPQATGYVLTVHAFTVVPITVVGAIFFRMAFPRLFPRRAQHEPA